MANRALKRDSPKSGAPFTFTLGFKLQSPLIKLVGKRKLLAPALYVVGAILIWLSFAQSNPDGLGNIWLVFYAFPIVIIGMFILHLQFP